MKNHLKVFFYALIFGMVAYGIMQIGISIHQLIIS
ncbi:MAG: hypothetical protein CFH08_00120 [Alphaproteobacteria bacterium MarineAlpha3_Bin7]|nr:MAG: hypothetical protein CFH08_00120 [Alphaproteobacteria bacterium MarineAlpha3_Bin7]